MSRTLEELRREQIEEIQRRKRQKRSIRTEAVKYSVSMGMKPSR